jgi:hypothetical protein
MLGHGSAIDGHAVDASNGDIGAAGDFLFDDASLRAAAVGRRYRKLAPRPQSPLGLIRRYHVNWA